MLLGRLGSIFSRFLVDFGLILAGILVGFPSIFGEVSGRCFARFLIKFSAIFGLLARFLVDCSSAVAGTQLCCALDPPRQAYGLRMAYRVTYVKKTPLLFLWFLMLRILSIPY